MAKAHIFISYAHEDKEWVLEGPGNIHLIPRIRRHTSPDAEIWFDEGLVIGEKWDEEIHNHIVQSHIAILLISESFVSSDYIVNKELVWIKEQVEKNDMKIVPLLIGNITEKSKRIIDWIYQRQIHPSETQPLCNYLNDKAQWDHMITSILNIIDAKIDQVLETLLLNENTRQAGYSIKPTVTPDSKTVTGNIENRDTKITDKTTAAHPTGVNPALYQEAIRLYRNHKYKEASDILLKLAAANNPEAQNLLCDILCNKVKGYQLWPGILETFLPYAEENLAFAQTIVGKVYYRGKLNERNYEKAFDWFSKAAESGNSYAQYLLGNMYENGTFVEQNYDTALSYYKNSAAQNNIMAIGEMAYMKDNGYGMPMNKEEAEKIYLQLAEERDDEWSMIKLSYIEMDRGNSEERLKWIQKALEKEYIDVYVDLGIFYQSDEKYKDLEKAQQSYYQAAQLGNPEGMNGLAMIYYDMPDNKGDEQAFRWFSKSADLGDSLGLYYLAVMYENGFGTNVDKQKAWDLYLASSDQKFSPAYRKIAQLIEEGEAPASFTGRELEYYIKAAERNDIDAIHDVIRFLENDPDRQKELFSWCQRGAQLNDGKCICKLGKLYFYGIGAEMDEFKAMNCFRKAETMEIPEAYYFLGLAYYEAKGVVSPNIQKAEEYFRKAAETGYSDAIKAIAELYMQSGQENGYEKAIEYLKTIAEGEHADIAYEGLMRIAVEQMNAQDYDDPQNSELYQKALRFETSGKEAGMTESLSKAFLDRGINLYNIEKYESAIAPLLLAAQMGESEAATHLGDLYFNGELAPKHMGKAYEYFLKASQNGSGYGSYSCGFILMKGSSDIPRDIEKGLSMFRLAVEQNYKAATRDLARYYYSLETEEDNRKALDYYLQYIEYNPKDTDTLLHIGLIYESGLGVPLNIDLARRYYERAAEQDEIGMAYNFLGGTYMNDEETESNERKAVHYFQKAIELGNTNAMFRISYYLHNGKGGLQVDIPREIELLTEASKRGNHQATYRLGLLFEDNESGMAQNLELSVKYFQLAADNGILAAINKMGELYLFGEVIPANLTKAISCFTAASEQGYGKASYWLGRLHTDGIGQLEKDTQKAMNYYRKAIEQGYEEAREWMEQLQKNLVDETITDIEIPQDKSDEELYKDAKNALEKAQFKTAYAYFSYLTQRNHAESFNELGDMYFYGRGMAINQAKALELYKKAATLDSVYGFFNVGFLYWNGPEEIQDPEQALQYLKKAVQMGYTYALSFIGDIYRTGPEELIDYAEAKRYYQKGVDVNEINAIKGMALLYLLGQGVTQNNAMGAFYLKKAADKGNAWAMYHLGRLYYYGEGIPRNPKLALDYLQMAYDANYPDACSLLGLLYERGEGTAPNIELANKLYIRGHELGDDQSMWYLACNYLDGNGLPKDYKRAEKLFIQAIERGNEPARIDLARMIFHGLGTVQDPQKAYEIIKPCLEQGYGRAYMLMGEVYENGLGVEKDYKQAKELYRKALDLGYSFAQEALDRLDKFC